MCAMRSRSTGVLTQRHGRHLTGQSRVAPKGFVLERTHHCNAAVSLTVVLSVKNNDPAFHPRPAGIGKLELAARDDGRRGWEPELARMRSRLPRLCRPDWDMVVSLHALAWDGSGRG